MVRVSPNHATAARQQVPQYAGTVDIFAPNSKSEPGSDSLFTRSD